MLPGFREFTTKFYWRCFDAAKELLRALALGIGLGDEDFFLRFHSGVNNQLRLLHYPPVEMEKLANHEIARESSASWFPLAASCHFIPIPVLFLQTRLLAVSKSDSLP